MVRSMAMMTVDSFSSMTWAGKGTPGAWWEMMSGMGTGCPVCTASCGIQDICKILTFVRHT